MRICPLSRIMSDHCSVIWIVLMLAILEISCSSESPINREALVNRHHVVNASFDTLASLTVGNGPRIVVSIEGIGRRR